MDKYTYADLIIDPKDPRLEIGAYYYFGGNAVNALERANEGKKEKELTWIYNGDDFDQRYIFGLRDTEDTGDSRIFTSFLIRKKEPTYAERQAEWVKENDIKVGDKVKILKEFSSGDFVDYMKPLVGTIGEIKEIGERIQVYTEDKDDWWYWPYYCLEKVEEKKYVPFDLSLEEDRAKLRGAWVRPKDCYPNADHLIRGISNITVWFGDSYLNAQELLNEYEFIDGSPCGKLVED